MSFPLMTGLSAFIITTFSVGFVITAIAAIGPSGRPVREVTLKEWLEHSWGFVLGIFPGVISGLLTYLAVSAVMSLIF